MKSEQENQDRGRDASPRSEAEDGDARTANGAEAAGDGDGGAAGASPEERLGALASERDDLKDRLLRLAAEFENYKKRNRGIETQAEVRGREAVLKDMLEVLDNLERAVGAYGGGATNGAVDGPAVLKGVSLVQRLFQSKLERHDVKPVPAQGQPFDPRLHEAISRVERADMPPGTVAVELQRGYTIGDRLLRPALVSVAAAPAAAAKDEGA